MCDWNTESCQSSLIDYATVTTCNILVDYHHKELFLTHIFVYHQSHFHFRTKVEAEASIWSSGNEKRGSENILWLLKPLLTSLPLTFH